jgi:anti-sigma regulatory factor (Ser/Thr protein kinase)
MQPLLEVCLKGGPEAPTRARNALSVLELGEACEDIVLLVSELVTNAVVHAEAEAIRLAVLMKDRKEVRVEITAPGPLWEPAAEPRPGPLGGFGFFFVDQLANDWGIQSSQGESQVWFEIARQAASAPGASILGGPT